MGSHVDKSQFCVTLTMAAIGLAGCQQHARNYCFDMFDDMHRIHRCLPKDLIYQLRSAILPTVKVWTKAMQLGQDHEAMMDNELKRWMKAVGGWWWVIMVEDEEK